MHERRTNRALADPKLEQSPWINTGCQTRNLFRPRPSQHTHHGPRRRLRCSRSYLRRPQAVPRKAARSRDRLPDHRPGWPVSGLSVRSRVLAQRRTPDARPARRRWCVFSRNAAELHLTIGCAATTLSPGAYSSVHVALAPREYEALLPNMRPLLAQLLNGLAPFGTVHLHNATPALSPELTLAGFTVLSAPDPADGTLVAQKPVHTPRRSGRSRRPPRARSTPRAC
jgi:hypothetical protein